MENISEQWKPIKGFEGLYEVSDLGRVKSVSRTVRRGDIQQAVREKVLSPKVSKKGYLIVGLHKCAKTRYKYIHRLVAEAFLEMPTSDCEVNHKDEDKTNNIVSNLEWCSHVANVNHGTGRCRHDLELIKPVSCYKDGVLVKRYESITQASVELGVGKSSVWAALSGKSKTCKGMIWKYD